MFVSQSYCRKQREMDCYLNRMPDDRLPKEVLYKDVYEQLGSVGEVVVCPLAPEQAIRLFPDGG